MGMHATRLRPGQDLKESLELFAAERGLKAAFVATGMGSLEKAELRLAGAEQTAVIGGPLEILCLSGTLGADGSHLHMAVSDSNGRVTGGHVCRGCKIYTMAEVVLGEVEGIAFLRRRDRETGYAELVVAASEAPKPAAPEG